MIAAWTFCVLAVGALLLVVGVSGEMLAAHLRRPRRVVWCVVMLAMCGLPAALRYLPAPLPLLPAAAAMIRLPAQEAATQRVVNQVSQQLQATSPPMMLRVTQGSANTVIVEPESVLLRADWLLPALLLTCTLIASLFVLAAALRMRRMRQQWTIADDATVTAVSAAAGRPVQVWRSHDIGPAAFGVRHPQVVLPQWVDTLDDGSRALLIAHEASHIAARDPMLLRIALTLVVLMPWNLPMLVAYRRLHRAVEHDCDRRVLHATGDARSYGRLLLATAERIAGVNAAPSWSRVSRWLPAPVAGIGLRHSELELRLRALVRQVSTWRTRGRALAAGGALVVGVLAACSVPAPERTSATSPLVRGNGSTIRIIASDPMANGGIASTTDSLAAIDEFMFTIAQRMGVLHDSVAGAAARRAEPHVFAESSDEIAIWLLFDSRYQVMRSNTGRQHYSVKSGRSNSSSRVSASASTPRAQLILGVDAFVRAFPGITPQNLKSSWSSTTVQVGQRSVEVNWARYIPADATTSAAPPENEADRINASSSTSSVPGQLRPADGAAATRSGAEPESLPVMKAFAIPVSVKSSAERDSTVIAAARFARPEVFAADSPEMHIWLLVDDHFSVLRSTTGVSFPLTADRKSGLEANLASSTEFYLKSFPELREKNLINSRTRTNVSVGSRQVSIFWARYVPTPARSEGSN